jgi:hypothetical protein
MLVEKKNWKCVRKIWRLCVDLKRWVLSSSISTQILGLLPAKRTVVRSCGSLGAIVFVLLSVLSIRAYRSTPSVPTTPQVNSASSSESLVGSDPLTSFTKSLQEVLPTGSYILSLFRSDRSLQGSTRWELHVASGGNVLLIPRVRNLKTVRRGPLDETTNGMNPSSRDRKHKKKYRGRFHSSFRN